MYHVSTQGVYERMINVYYYNYYHDPASPPHALLPPPPPHDPMHQSTPAWTQLTQEWA